MKGATRAPTAKVRHSAVRMPLSSCATRRPVRISAQRCPLGRVAGGGRRTEATATITATKLSAFKAKAAPSPPTAITSAARPGPTIRPRLYWAEERLTADRRSSLGTSSERSAEETGAKSALAQPARKANTETAGSDRRPRRASAASPAARRSWAQVSQPKSWRRSVRSAMAPPSGPSTSAGRYISAATVAVQPPRPVVCVTQTPTAMVSIHVPTLEMKAPSQKRR